MPSIVPNFEYDIFISYRHKDNKGHYWVTKFVSALKTELEATFKEDISIYFDANPHDGLLETHNVDKSLESKLKCLIFIPIISQTYCDIKSFAWQYEFCAFNKLAQEDQFGRDIKLNNGNVASRILPIKIHDLDSEDHSLLEKELGGVLRPIEFIFKSTGVNRPLHQNEDHPNENLNKVFYRDQVNKVANAIKEIITSLKNPDVTSSQETNNHQPKTKPTRSKRISVVSVVLLLLLIVLSYYLLPKLFSSAKEDAVLNKSIAVLPFVNMSNDPNQEYFSDGLTEELLNVLTKINDLKVIARTSSFSFKGKNEDVRVIGAKLGVTHILEGSVRKSGNKIRITTQLIRVIDGTHLWSETYDREMEEVFQIQDEIAGAILSKLEISFHSFSSEVPSKTKPEVSNLLLRGNYFYEKRDKANLEKADEIYLQAKAIDSLDARVWVAIAKNYIALSFFDNSKFEEGKIIAHKALALDDALPEVHRIIGYLKLRDRNYQEAEVEYRKVIQLQPGNADVLRNIGTLMKTMGRLNESIDYTNKAISLDPVKAVNYWSLSTSLTFAGHYDQALSTIKTLTELQPEYPIVHNLLAEIYLLQGKPDLSFAEIELIKSESGKNFFRTMVYHSLGQMEKSAETLSKLSLNNSKISWGELAQLYSFLGRKDEAFDFMEKAYEANEDLLSTMKTDPLFKSLRSDPRFTVMLKKMNLPL